MTTYSVNLKPQTYKRLSEIAAQENRAIEDVAATLLEAKPIEHPHIERREDVLGGKPVLRGTRMPVWQIVWKWKAGDTLDLIHENYPQLSMAALYDAISYYHDHPAEIEEQIEDNKIENVLKNNNATMDEKGVITFHDSRDTITLESQTYKRLAERAAQENRTVEQVAAFLIESQPTEHPYIIRREGSRGGKPILRDASIAVWLIVALWKAGDSLEEIHAAYSHVSLATLYDAISYYFDHQAEIEQQIEDNKIENALKKHNATMTEDGIIKFNDVK